MADFDYNNEFVEDRYSTTAKELKKVTNNGGTGLGGLTNILAEHKTPTPPSTKNDGSGGYDDNDEFVETHYS